MSPPNEPTVLRIYWNTLRSFTRRRLGLAPLASRGTEPAPGRGILLPVAVIAAVAVVATTVVVLNTGDTGSGSSPLASSSATPKSTAAGTGAAPTATLSATVTPPPLLEPSPQVRSQAAHWITGNIAPGQRVGCDAALCAALHSAGLPDSSVVRLQDNALDLLKADLAVVTGPLRIRLGDTADQLTAPQPLAVFGPADQPVTVVAVARNGRDAYSAVLAADLAARKAAGAGLLRNKRLAFAPVARAALAAGQVDLRLCAVLTDLSAAHALGVTAFSAPAPGAGPSVARTGMDIATVDKRLADGPSGQARELRTTIGTKRPPFHPLRMTGLKRQPKSNPVLSVLYAQPSPMAAAR